MCMHMHMHVHVHDMNMNMNMSVLIMCHLTPLILMPTHYRTAPTGQSRRAGHGLFGGQINSRASACYNRT